MIRIICIGKLKEKYWCDAVLEYQKRLTKYTKLEIIELDDSNTVKEKNLILRYLNERDYIVTLEIEGEVLNSVEFSNKIKKWEMINSNIIFIIGGSDGLHDEIKDRSNYHLSFSKLTFPHQMFRVILLEQIYRSYRIINNENYHK